MSQNSRLGLVLALASLFRVLNCIYMVNYKHFFVSIIIPTMEGRSSSLRATLESLEKQTYKNFEVIKVTEEGELAALRNQGAKRAKGSIFTFIDDDVVCVPTWLDGIVEAFNLDESIGGVSGPSIVDSAHRVNRDIFKHKLIKRIYDWLFLDGNKLPGRITKAGTWTTRACDEESSYEGPVDYLEACNMSFRRASFERAGGFDERFRGVGDWSEPDLAFRIRKLGYKLWFSSRAKLYHNPSKSGVFKKRFLDSKNRLKNYLLFADRHVTPHWRNHLYKGFLNGYYLYKTIIR